jgi:Protein of unknown function (DUF1214)
MARLDRLGPAKEVPQIGAAIGREFSHALLAAVVRKPEAELGSPLNRIIAAGLLFRQGIPPHASYLFKHALVQDAPILLLLHSIRLICVWLSFRWPTRQVPRWHDALTASGLDNGEPFPSINSMDKPAANADGSIDIYFSPTSPGVGRNWLRTVPDKDYFVALRLYGPTEAFFNQTWRANDLQKIQ